MLYLKGEGLRLRKQNSAAMQINESVTEQRTLANQIMV
jgi:hypothetical protein